jgi:hypothetical protein
MSNYQPVCFTVEIPPMARDKTAEAITVLTQVMDVYKDLAPNQTAAVVAWFSACYGSKS